jgi:hypothetical protein
VELGGARWSGSGGGAGELERLEVEDGADSRGPVDRDEGEAASLEGVNQKGKRISREDATNARDRWAGRGGFDLRGQRGQRAGWARGRVGRKVGGAENKEKGISELKIRFLNLSRLWKFIEGDLGGILT